MLFKKALRGGSRLEEPTGNHKEVTGACFPGSDCPFIAIRLLWISAFAPAFFDGKSVGKVATLRAWMPKSLAISNPTG